MARTTATEVKEIMDNCTLDDTIVDAYITPANVVVTKVFDGDANIGATLKEEIEKWLAAHMIASTRWRTTTDEKIGEASVRYTGKFGMGLDLTPYGQMVKTLDITGKISRLGKSRAYIYAATSFDYDA